MAKSKRNRRAQNKVGEPLEGVLVKTDPNASTPAAVRQTSLITVARPTLFTAEFEKVIEIIARERVYRETLAKLGSRLLMAPTTIRAIPSD